jgi:hypothetical protein
MEDTTLFASCDHKVLFTFALSEHEWKSIRIAGAISKRTATLCFVMCIQNLYGLSYYSYIHTKLNTQDIKIDIY